MNEKVTWRQWLAVAGAILGAFMAILDIQITNSSLAEIEGAIGASADEGSWITTGYLMAEIIVIPMTGWLGSIFGLRRYLSINSLLFVGFSMACALSTSLTAMILFRAGQGFTGGILIPTAVSIVRGYLPREKQAIGIALFGLVATFAPAIGPTLGGWLTDNFSWRMLFYLNLAPGAVAVTLQLTALDRAPMRLGELAKGDWPGIVFMSVGLSSATVVLEEGQRMGWLDSSLILWLTILSGVSLTLFLIRELTALRPFINLRLLAQPTLGSSCFLMAVVGSVTYGSIFVVPAYLAQVQGYNAEQIGGVVMWSGLPQLVLFPAMPFLMRRVDARLLVAAGTLLFAVSCFINVGLTHDVGADQLILPQLLRAIGQPLFSIPLSQLATVGLNPRDTADASSLSMVMRNLGGSIGIAMLSTIIQGRERFHFSAIAETMTQSSLRLEERLSGMTLLFQGLANDPATARLRAIGQLAGQVRREAWVMAFADSFYALAILLVVSLAAIPLLAKPPARA